MVFEGGDYIDSDSDSGELEEIIEYTKRISGLPRAGANTDSCVNTNNPERNRGNDTMDNTNSSEWRGHPNQEALAKLAHQLAVTEVDLKEVNDSIAALTKRREKLVHDQNQLKASIRELKASSSSSKGKQKAGINTINYSEDEFDWDNALRVRMKKVWGIQDFRHCQRGVCNANMDGRDIVCVMPTGGGKSLTYQLPALLTSGCTLVISPLLALINDQVLGLRELGIEAVMLTGETPKHDKQDTLQRLRQLAKGEVEGKEIKLCYVTPEKLAKDKSFVALLSKLAVAGRLARFVIDEAHCVSQLGHDFRPDYKQLHILRHLFPNVPIMALSATCPPHVLKDLVKILGLKSVINGNEASMDEGTLYFSSPLYRPNLYYKILPKPNSSASVYQTMVDWIEQSGHLGDCGIVYCFSQKDAEHCALELSKASGGRIKTGVYHAHVDSGQKMRLHEDWRAGKVKVVCATIAFGLGIDKGDVRFVIHHSIPKSVDGYYQESGRAGRDGKDSDCVLYYRPQDWSGLAGMVGKERSGLTKLHDVLKFAEDLRECRKIQFANYFSHSSNISLSSWSTSTTDALQRCGHCDNCLRSPESLETRDVTKECWKILKVMHEAQNMGTNITLIKLVALVRGKGGSKIEVTQRTGRGRGKVSKETVEVDLDRVCGGPVELSGPDTERLIIKLLIDEYLQEDCRPSSYTVNVYLVKGGRAAALLHLTQDQVGREGVGRKIEMCFVKDEKGKGRSKKKDASNSVGGATNTGGEKGSTKTKTKKVSKDTGKQLTLDGLRRKLNTNDRTKQVRVQRGTQYEEDDESDPDEFIDINEGVEDTDTDMDSEGGEAQERAAGKAKALPVQTGVKRPRDRSASSKAVGSSSRAQSAMKRASSSRAVAITDATKLGTASDIEVINISDSDSDNEPMGATIVDRRRSSVSVAKGEEREPALKLESRRFEVGHSDLEEGDGDESDDDIVNGSDSADDEGWMVNQRGKPPPRKIRKVGRSSSGDRTRVNGSLSPGKKRTWRSSEVDEDDIVVLSD